MSEKKGTKESRELLIGVLFLAGLLIKRFKDGFQIEDLSAILSSMGTEPKVVEALRGVAGIGAEFKDMDTEEAISLVMVVLMETPSLISAIKGE